MTNVAVFGTGSWGTAFGMVLAEAGCEVTLWGRRVDLVETITDKRENPDYLPGVELPVRLRATTDPAAALDGAAFAVLAIPAQTVRENLTAWTALIPGSAVLVSLAKGIELGTAKRMSEVIREVTGAPEDRVVAVSGPNLAREVAVGQPAASVIACADESVAASLQAACHTAYFRPYTNTDVVGVELGGAAKNVIALAVGMADGLGFGDNSKATLIARGLAEITRLGVALGADPLTFAGLAGVGDLVATCYSPLSRNRTFGANVGRGMSVAEVAAATQQTAEGVKSCRSILDLGIRHGVEMPIAETVVAIVHEGRAPGEMVRGLMLRMAKPERPAGVPAHRSWER